MLRPHAALVDLLDEGHNKLRLLHNGILLAVTLHHIHGIELVFSACHQVGHRSLFAAQGFHQCAKLALRVTNEDFIIGVIGMEHKEGDQLFHRKRFSRAGNAQVKSRLV